MNVVRVTRLNLNSMCLFYYRLYCTLYSDDNNIILLKKFYIKVFIQAFAATCFQDSQISYLTNKQNKNLPKNCFGEMFHYIFDCLWRFNHILCGWTLLREFWGFVGNPKGKGPSRTSSKPLQNQLWKWTRGQSAKPLTWWKWISTVISWILY